MNDTKNASNTNNNSLEQNLNSIDAFKFLAAVLVIMLHANPLKYISYTAGIFIRNALTIIAVPYFFAVGGYLFFRGNRNIKRYVYKTGRMYILWSLIYFPFVLNEWIQSGNYDVLNYLRRFVLEGSYSTIWYLVASLVGTVFVYLLRKKFNNFTVFGICLIFYLIGCGFSYYYYLLDKIYVVHVLMNIYYGIFDTTKNGLLFGAVFISIGECMTKKRIPKIRNCIIGICISYIAIGLEALIMPKIGLPNRGVDLKISLVPFTYYLLSLLLQIRIGNKQSKVFPFIRNISVYMFLTQRIFLNIFAKYQPNEIFPYYSIIYFLLVFLSTLLLSITIVILKGRVLHE